ncbi:hypothetical protein PN462_14380 [Spirulina sp. CS-785/01]|uniref:hypothetical protein n=1 Tax=Spirulina sp. CS-785/01 TaxID=3021716 RepID=UPI00232E4B6B|nr:hypothetical protein [Spirulina sp. CS-785/01]MDB9314297.1 hypothetical protein [Spirulina sp. CS-785/01]
MSTVPNFIHQQLEDWKPYSPQLAKIAGGVTGAVLLGYLLEQGQEWVELSEGQIQQATGLTRKEQEMACTALKNRGLLTEQLSQGKRQGHLEEGVLQEQITQFQQLVFSAPSPPPSHPQTDPYFAASRFPSRTSTTPNYRFEGPWKSQEELNAFHGQLLEHFKEEGHPRPGDAAFYEIDRLSKGLLSPYWEDFQQGHPMGTSQQVQREWEVEPGVPYPAFQEERVQYYVHKGEPLESAMVKARFDLQNPKIAQVLWEGFLRKCDRLAEQGQKALELGVKTPYLPPSFSDRKSLSKQSVIEKLQALQPPPQLEAAPPEEKPEHPPDLETLQNAYNSPLGRSIIARQIAQHPEWGYKIVDGEIVDLYPF